MLGMIYSGIKGFTTFLIRVIIGIWIASLACFDLPLSFIKGALTVLAAGLVLGLIAVIWPGKE